MKKTKNKDMLYYSKMYLISIMAAVITTLILITLIALLMDKVGLSQNQVSIAIYAVYLLSAFAAGITAGKLQKEKKFVWGAIAGILWVCVVLLASVCMHGGKVDGKAAFTAFLCMTGGGMLGGMLA